MKRGLLLDDFLTTFEDLRSDFGIKRPSFGLAEIEKRLRHRDLHKLIGRIISWHRNAVYSRPHPFLDEIGEDVYGALEQSELSSRHKIADGRVIGFTRECADQNDNSETLTSKDAKEGQINRTYPSESQRPP